MHRKATATAEPTLSSVQALGNGIITWLSDYLESSGKAGYVLGMSGGVDSSVLTLLARDAVRMRDKKLLALILPIDNDYYDQKVATDICNEYDVESLLINLKETYEAWKPLLLEATNLVVYTNLKARLREGTIYYYANEMDLLVLGTVNKPEFTIGYFPKNASAGDLLPQADLLKMEIRAIGESYGLPDEVVNAKASGCIWAATAEEEWGIDEDELDELVIALEGGEEAVLTYVGISDEKKRRFLEMHRESAHKREYYPMFLRDGNDCD